MNINGVKHWETLSLRFAADQRNINERQFKLIYTVVQLNLHNTDTKGNMDPTIYNTELRMAALAPRKLFIFGEELAFKTLHTYTTSVFSVRH